MGSGFASSFRVRFWRKSPVVSVLRLDGTIGPGGARLRPQGLNMQTLAAPIERAFAPRRLAAVAIVVNSPGGTPAQASLIAGRIRALAEEKKVPVLAFAEDVAASGGYWLACAGDEIFVDAASLIGSIGVVYAGFGFQNLIARHGVERRLHVAGAHKGALDPFLPEDAEEVARLRALQEDIHDRFKEMVRNRRAGRLKADETELFSGAFWTGTRAVEMGLADGIGDVRSVLRGRFGDNVRMVGVPVRRSFLRSLTGGTRERGGDAPSTAAQALADGVIAAIEERLIWSRFGL